MVSGQRLGRARAHLRRRGQAAAAVALIAVFSGAPSAFAEVTHFAVRLRDAATGTTSAADVGRLQAISALARTGIGAVSVTYDGAYRIGLAPPLSDDGAKAALARLRMDPGVLYAEIAAEPSAAAIAAARGAQPSPPIARIIVKFRDPQVAADAAADLPLAASRVAQVAARAGRPLSFERTIAWAGAHVLQLMTRVPVGDAEAIANAIAQDPDVEWVQPDYWRFRQIVPNDPLYSSQWHYFDQVTPGQTAVGGANLPGAWNRTTGWSGIRTAVLDTGALKTHPDLAGRFIGGYDFIKDWVVANDNDPVPPVTCPASNPLSGGCDNRDADASDPGDWVTAAESAGSTLGGWLQGCPVDGSSWHGSHVAGTIGAATNNATGVAGINWTSRIVPLRVLGKCGGYDSDIADAMVWASGAPVSGAPTNPYPARVVNLSLGGGGACAPVEQNAVNTALANNTALIIAAGNENADAAGSSPGNCNGVVTVAAVGRNGQRASYSNFGSLVEIAGPGGSDGQTVLSTLNSGQTTPASGVMNYVGYQGTSMATPHVAGIVSLMLSLKPSLTPAQVTSLLQSTARAFPTGTGRDCTSNLGSVGGGVQFCGAGMVNADAVLMTIATTGGTGGTALTVTSATLASTANPSAFGTPITLVATITGGSAGLRRVTFTDNDVPIAGCVNMDVVAGPPLTAQCVTSSLAVGTHALRAVYTPYDPTLALPANVTHTPADSPILSQVVNPVAPQPSTTTLASSANPSSQGASVTFTATVSGIAPTGTVNFRAAGITIAGCGAVALSGAGDTRTSQCSTSALPAGVNAIEAVYSGNAGNLTSTGTFAQGVIAPGACANFNDVLSSSPFCSSVQWMFNRAITTGCTSVEYCPDSPVSRLGMAAFMAREGNALTSVDIAPVTGLVQFAMGPSPTVTCFDASRNYAVTGSPRRAKLQGLGNVYGAANSTAVSVQFAYSTNGGTSWALVPGQAAELSWYSGRSPTDDQTATVAGELDLAPGTSYLFGLAFSAAPAAASVQVYCSQQARIFNRTSASAPF